MLFFFRFVFASTPIETAATYTQVLSHQNSVPYCSIGLLQVTFSRIKLKEKDSDSFQIVAVKNIYQGTAFLIQSGVVITAAHVIMPNRFVLDEKYSSLFETTNYHGQLPEKVEFFPFYPNGCAPAVQELQLDQEKLDYSPQSDAGEEFHMRQNENRQKSLKQYFVVSEIWRHHLSKLETQAATGSTKISICEGDYTVAPSRAPST
jgi:hypothetical protein